MEILYFIFALILLIVPVLYFTKGKTVAKSNNENSGTEHSSNYDGSGFS